MAKPGEGLTDTQKLLAYLEYLVQQKTMKFDLEIKPSKGDDTASKQMLGQIDIAHILREVHASGLDQSIAKVFGKGDTAPVIMEHNRNTDTLDFSLNPNVPGALALALKNAAEKDSQRLSEAEESLRKQIA